MRKRTIMGTLLTILVTLLLTGLPYVAADEAVTIDIKPCKEPNVLNVNVIGWLPVAIFVDSEIESGTVTLHVKGSEEPYVEPAAWSMWDGYPLAKFDAEEVIDRFGPFEDDTTLMLVLEGQFTDGTPFWGEDDLKFFTKGKR